MVVIYILLTEISYQCIFSKVVRSEIICGLSIFFIPQWSFGENYNT